MYPVVGMRTGNFAVHVFSDKEMGKYIKRTPTPVKRKNHVSENLFLQKNFKKRILTLCQNPPGALYDTLGKSLEL